MEKSLTGLEGFEPPTSGLEARRYVQAKPQAHLMPDNYVLQIINMIHDLLKNREIKMIILSQ